MLVPVGVVCQYQVTPAGGVPLLVNITPASAHCGELDVGFPGFAGAGFTVIVANPEVTSAHTPLFTKALKKVVCVKIPIAGLVNVVVVFEISVVADQFGKVLEVDFCHLVTFPTLPDNVKSAGVLPLQIV